MLGLIIAAIMSAAMSTISSGMNASATVFMVDIYQRYIKPEMTSKQSMTLIVHCYDRFWTSWNGHWYCNDRCEKCSGCLVVAFRNFRRWYAGAYFFWELFQETQKMQKHLRLR